MALTAIDLFCGAGGLSEGFSQAGFDVLVGNDIDHSAGLTFSLTHPDARFLEGPIEEFSAQDFLAASGLKAGSLDCLVGGPPCQGFSVYNHQRGIDDPRTTLPREYMRLVRGLKPKWIVMENVTGMTSVDNGLAVEGFVRAMDREGYKVETRILKAEQFGIPQERRRLFFVGNRIGVPIPWPEATHGVGKKPYTTIWDAIGDLPAIRNGDDSQPLRYRSPAQNTYQRDLRRGSREVQNHGAPRLSALNLERMKHVRQGGSWRDIPFDLLPEGMKRAKRSDHTKRYGRMKPNGLACTILTKCDVHWGAYIHPYQDRAISVREAARLQSFPDRFVFQGSRTDQYVQVGNAVPPMLGRRVAESILSAISPARATVSRVVRPRQTEPVLAL
jgi:DNA (cytosine-5)-methyltransferase 1